MINPILAFGEILWDSLPRGLFPGGAPFNVAAHLAHLNSAQPVAIVSAVGSDFLGRELRRRAEHLGIDTRCLATIDSHPTGIVEASLDSEGRPRYTIVEDVAWDHIPATPEVTAAVAGAPALVFGTLASRNPENRSLLIELLRRTRGLRVYDVNLRPPHTPPATVAALLPYADLIKLNHEELATLTGWEDARSDVPAGIRMLLQRIPARDVCVTCGPNGAWLHRNGNDYFAAAPRVNVRDTIGAGDAFTAALVNGLTAHPSADSEDVLATAVAHGSFVAGEDGAIPF